MNRNHQSVLSLRVMAARVAASHLTRLAPREHAKVAGRPAPLYLVSAFSELPAHLQQEVLAQAVRIFGDTIDPYVYEVLADPRWQSLDLTGHVTVIDSTLRPFLRCRKLNAIVLRGCSKVSLKVVTQLVAQQQVGILRRLDLSHCISSTGVDALARAIANVAPRLTSLSLSHSLHLTDAGIAHLVHNCQSLTELNISYCPLVTNVPFEKLLALQILDISGTEIGSTGFDNQRLPNLHSFRSTLSQVTDIFLDALLCHTSGTLSVLDVGACPVTGTALCKVAQNRSPQKVSLAGIRNLHWGSVQDFAVQARTTLTTLDLSHLHGIWLFDLARTLEVLEELYIDNASAVRVVNDTRLDIEAQYSGFPSLRKFSACETTYEAGPDATTLNPNALVQVLLRSHQLEDLNLSRSELDDRGLAALADPTSGLVGRVKRLELRVCRGISGASIVRVAETAECLEHLDIRKCFEISIRDFHSIQKLRPSASVLWD